MHYRFGTFRLHTTLRLPSLPALAQEGSSVFLRIEECRALFPEGPRHWDHHWKQQDSDSPVLSLSRLPEQQGFLLQAPRLAEFLLQPGSGLIAVQRPASTDDATLEHLLLDQILPRCLAHHGRVIAHAGSVRIDGRGALLMGPTGAGKSTLAALLAAAGHDLHSDDCVELEAVHGGIDAIPTYPSLRMRPDSIAAVHPEGVGTRPMANYSDKLRLSAGDSAQASRLQRFPAHAIYLLGTPGVNPDSIEIRDLPPLQACTRLIQHSFQLDPTDTTHATAHLQRCAHVARHVPAYTLHYPRDYSRSRELVDALAAHLRQH